VEELEKAIMGKKVDYEGDFEYSEGAESCQDMASQFLKIMGGSEDEKRVLYCFMNYIRFFVGRKYDEHYWETHKPIDIIDISNEIVRELETHRDAFPLDKELLIDLLYVLFRWMYKNKWTDHKLVKRSSETESAKV
jgi:hypothetical protein